MIASDSSQIAPESLTASWRISGVDFDRGGEKSTLHELLEMGGFFPLSSIEDRLPFSSSTLRKWSKNHEAEFSAFIVPFRAEADGRAVITLIHLNRLDAYLNSKIHASWTLPV